ncbi:hypothetical protein [Rhizobium sp. NRK18]|jgi:Na+-transporting NADH:ubiquinone oxidoreductase subunit NqrC|nr:hypothetical protein [Rhizobium sp. NRK18]MCQ2004179.1 hypothetical protein [Rhizobium sp. NRK18]
MFIALILLSTLIATMFVTSIAFTVSELQHEAKEMKQRGNDRQYFI